MALEDIVKDWEKSLISSDCAINSIILLLYNVDREEIRYDCITVLERIESKTKKRNEKIFKVLENFLISDENSMVRLNAVSVILTYYLERGISVLKWVVEHDPSPCVLLKLYQWCWNSNDQCAKLLKEQVGELFSARYGVILFGT